MLGRTGIGMGTEQKSPPQCHTWVRWGWECCAPMMGPTQLVPGHLGPVLACPHQWRKAPSKLTLWQDLWVRQGLLGDSVFIQWV